MVDVYAPQKNKAFAPCVAQLFAIHSLPRLSQRDMANIANKAYITNVYTSLGFLICLYLV